MSIKVMSAVWDESPASETALLLHLALADWSDDRGKLLWDTSHEILAHKCRTSVRNVQRLLAKMEADGLLEFEADRARGGRGHKATFRTILKLRQIDGVSQAQTLTETATVRASAPSSKRLQRNTPNPREAGADLNPRSKGQSPRQLGTSPRQRAKAEERLKSQFRMARTIGIGCAGAFDDEVAVRREIAEQTGSVAPDVMEAGIEAWRARRAEVSA